MCFGLVEGLQLYYKATPTQVFLCEICGSFKNTYFGENMQMTASMGYLFRKVKFSRFEAHDIHHIRKP